MPNHDNVVVLRGTIGNEPTHREIPSGEVWQFDLRTDGDAESGAPSRSVPLAWLDPTDAELLALEPGLAVVVVGSVQRRFFRAGGATQSRTEVVVERLVPVRRRATVSALVADVVARLSPGAA